MKLITHELLKSWRPCADGYNRFCELFPEGATLEVAIEGLVADNHDDWGYWLFNQCRERKLFNEFVSKGYRNAGDLNAGNRNAGNRNAGDWNAGNRNAGHFNTITPDEIMVFNRPCKREMWDTAYKPSFLYFDLCVWISETEMTDQEKVENPKFYVAGGYLKKRDYKEAFRASWDNADKKERMRVKDLPNFNAALFKEISGIDVEAA